MQKFTTTGWTLGPGESELIFDFEKLPTPIVLTKLENRQILKKKKSDSSMFLCGIKNYPFA